MSGSLSPPLSSASVLEGLAHKNTSSVSTIVLQVPDSDHAAEPAHHHAEDYAYRMPSTEVDAARATESPVPPQPVGSQVQFSCDQPDDISVSASPRPIIRNEEETEQPHALQDSKHSLIEIGKTISRPTSKQSQLDAQEDTVPHASPQKPFPDIHSQLARRKIKDLMRDEDGSYHAPVSQSPGKKTPHKTDTSIPAKRKSASPSKPLSILSGNPQKSSRKRARKQSSKTTNTDTAASAGLTPLKLRPMPSPEAHERRQSKDSDENQHHLIIDSATRKVSIIKFSRHGPVNQGRWGHTKPSTAPARLDEGTDGPKGVKGGHDTIMESVEQ